MNDDLLDLLNETIKAVKEKTAEEQHATAAQSGTFQGMLINLVIAVQCYNDPDDIKRQVKNALIETKNHH